MDFHALSRARDIAFITAVVYTKSLGQYTMTRMEGLIRMTHWEVCKVSNSRFDPVRSD